MGRRRDYDKLKRSPEVQCFRAFFYWILFLVYTPIFICLVLYTASLTDLKCSVESFSVPQLSEATNNHSIFFDVKIHNEFTDMRVFYDNLNLTFHLYNQNKSRMYQVGNYTARKFYQGSSMTTHIVDHFNTYEVPMESIFQNGSGSSNKIFRVNLQTKARFENFWMGGWHKWRVGADVEVDRITGDKVKKEGVMLEFSRQDKQHLHLLRLVKYFFWIIVILSLFCFPCFLATLLAGCCINSKRKRNSKPLLGVTFQPQMLAPEGCSSLSQISQLQPSSTTEMEQPNTISLRILTDCLAVPSISDVEQPGTIALHIATDCLVTDPPTSDAEQPANICLHAEIDSLVIGCPDVDQNDDKNLRTSISSTMVHPYTEQPKNR